MGNSILYEEVKRLENEQSFEAALQNIYTKHIMPGDTVIDVGAHWGRHTLPFSYLVGSSGKIISVEANPSIVTFINDQLAKFHVENVDVHSVALSNEMQSGMDFFVAVDYPEESGLRVTKHFNNETKIRKEKVDVITLDSLDIKGNVSFIKIDVEGAEFFVIQGAKNTILKYNPVIAFEFGENSYDSYNIDPSEVYEYFESIGYEVFSIHGDLLDNNTFVSSSKIQEFWDYIACPKKTSDSIQRYLKSHKAIKPK